MTTLSRGGRPPPVQRLVVLSSLEAERRVLVCDQQERVSRNSKAPSEDANHVVEVSRRIPSGKNDGEPGNDRNDQHQETKYGEHDVVGDG